ncbi:MAG TPA: PAS domain S-box protein [Rhodocyclaceae bacterium]
MSQSEASTTQLIRSIYRRQTAIAVLLIFLSLGSLTMISILISNNEQNAEIINVAGRQRMLSQRVALYAVRHFQETDPIRKGAARDAALAALSEFEKGQERLTRYARNVDNDHELYALYFGPTSSLDKDSRQFIAAAHLATSTTAAAAPETRNNVELILRMADTSLINPLDRATRLFQENTEHLTQRSSRLLFASSFLTVAFIIISFYAVSRPMIRRLRVDVAERDEAERALRQSEEIKRSIVMAAMDGIVTIDRFGNTVEFNESAEKLFGFAAKDVLGKPISDFIIPERFRSAHKQGLQRNRAGESSKVVSRRQELVAINAAGEEFPIELSITHTPGVSWYVAFIRDLTEQKRAEEALRRSQKLKAMGQLTGGIAHDFNNLMAIIMGNLELLGRTVGDNPAAQKRVETAIKTTQRGADLTRRLLLFSRQDGDTAPKSTVQINDLLTGMLDVLTHTLSRNVEIEPQFSADLWPVSLNPHEFEDCIVNLGINARDAMPGGGRLSIATRNVPSAEIASQAIPDLTPGDYVLLTIGDTGCGIAKDLVDRIFEPFFSTKARGKGTGLGLSMVYGAIQRAGGAIRVESEPGQGTRFLIYLPRLIGAAEVKPQDDEAAMVGGNESILVVDDEPMLREVAQSMLKDLGYRVDTAISAVEAWDRLEHGGDIDLVLSDIVMPGAIDGIGLARNILTRGTGPKIVLATGYCSYDAEKQDDPTLDALVRDALSKPYTKLQLARKVRRALDGA